MSNPTSTLRKKLDAAMDDFSEEIRGFYSEDLTPATRSDIEEVARQTYYLFGRFRDEIIAYLEKH